MDLASIELSHNHVRFASYSSLNYALYAYE